MFDNLINNETEHKKVLSDCDLCGSKQVSCLYFKLRDNFAATMRNDDYYKEVSDTAIRGTEKYVCYVCISDIITETMVKYQQASFKPTTIKPSEPKKVKQEPVKAPPFDIDAYEQRSYIDYRLYGLSNAQIAEQFKITEEQLSEKIERWTHQEEEEIRKYEENYITDEERIARNKAIK